ncbi:capping complex subunit for YIEGIA [Paenibacillus sp. MBLB4367]|uniref:capping complex subunit for YIEGIA n=1 Tax=Paenibacillus sp. MBLB4367 TaxID=3384767 RepID=UPI0039081DAF
MAKIVAVVVYRAEQVDGGAPIFIAEGPVEQQQLAFSLEKILDANAHDLKNGVIILVDHS